mgnify:CR=1 FL=1
MGTSRHFRVGALLLLAYAPDGAQAQQKEGKKGWSLEWDRRPSLRYGKQFRMDFRLKLQTDFAAVDDDPEPDRPAYDFRRKRVGVEGEFLRDFEYEFDVELDVERDAIRDAFINYRRLRFLQLQAGKFRIPFGRDQNTPPMQLDFVYRSRVGSQLAPGRDVGLMLHARVWNRRLHYQAGVFRHDGRIAMNSEDRPTGGRTWAARLRSKPDDWVRLAKPLRQLELGVAAAWSELPESPVRNGLRGRTAFDLTFAPRAYVAGRRLRSGVEAEWASGPFGAQAEFVRVRDERRGQSIFGDDLPNLISQGWYVAGTWVLTGEKKDGGVRPKREFLNGGFGAVELAIRSEDLRVRSADSSALAFAHPRAANFPPIQDRAWTFGINWYLNRHVKIQGNFVRERVDDVDFGSFAARDRQTFWMRVARVQLVF